LAWVRQHFPALKNFTSDESYAHKESIRMSAEIPNDLVLYFGVWIYSDYIDILN